MCDGKREGEKRREEGKGERVTLGEPVIERMTGRGNERGMKKEKHFAVFVAVRSFKSNSRKWLHMCGFTSAASAVSSRNSADGTNTTTIITTYAAILLGL